MILNIALGLLGAVMALVLGVVALIYAIYAGETPRLARDLPGLLGLAAVFGLFAALMGVSSLALYRRWRGWWLLEAAMRFAQHNHSCLLMLDAGHSLTEQLPALGSAFEQLLQSALAMAAPR